jgi:hypothetical protein
MAASATALALPGGHPPDGAPAVSAAGAFFGGTTPVDLGTLWTSAGVDGDTKTLILEAIGGDPASPMEFAQIALSDFAAALSAISGLTVLQKGRARQFFRSLREAHGLDPDSDWAKPAAGPPSKRARRMDEVAEPGSTTTVLDLGPDRIRTLFAEYQLKYGDLPAPDTEPTAEQISAVHQLMASSAPPYVDFSIFGPHGQRTLRKLSHTALQYNPVDGSWKRKEQDGPASFDSWWKSWRVFKTTMLLLDAALPERLDRYAEHIRDLVTTYGHPQWWLIYRADVRMRQEHMSRMFRRHCLVLPEPGSSFALRPWDTIFLEAVSERDFWDSEVRTPAFLLAAKQAGGGQGGQGTSNRAQRPPRPSKGPDASRAATPPSAEYCHKWNNNKCEHPCPAGRIHKCSFCGHDHRRADCRQAAAKKAKGAGKPSKGKGKGKGKSSEKPRT